MFFSVTLCSWFRVYPIFPLNLFFFGHLVYLCSTPPLELKPESIKQFRDLLPEAPSQAVIDCLNHCKGNVKNAINYFNGGYSKSRSGIATAQVVVCNLLFLSTSTCLLLSFDSVLFCLLYDQKKFSGMAVDQDSSPESPLVEVVTVSFSSLHTINNCLCCLSWFCVC